MDPLWGTKVCTWTQLDCVRTSSQRKPCFSQNDNKWDRVLARRLDCPSMCLKEIILNDLSWWKRVFANFSCYFVLNLQCFEGKPLFEFDRKRMFRSGLVGFSLHGSLSHYYYQFCEVIIVVHIWSVGLFVDFLWMAEIIYFWFPGSFSFPRLVGCPCQSCLWPNGVGSSLEQHLFCGFGVPAFWISNQYF